MMQFTINRRKLDLALAQVTKAITGKSPLRILEGLKITLSEEGLTLRGSDNEITITYFLPAIDGEVTNIEDIEPGETLIGSRYISEIVKKMEGDKIRFELIDDSILKIKDDRSEFSLHTMILEEYPNIETEFVGETITIPATTLKEIIRQTVFAVCVKDTRPILMGVNFRAANNLMDCVASDTYRLSKKTIAIKENVSFDTIVPAKTLNIISSILADSEDVVFNIAASHVTFVQKNLIINSKIINGPFPDVSKLVFKEFECSLAIKRPIFISAIERAALLDFERNAPVRLSMSPTLVEINAASQEIGYTKEKIDHAIFVGQPFSISFSSQYMIEALKALDKEEISVFFSGEMRPFIVKNEKDESLIQIILPVRHN